MKKIITTLMCLVSVQLYSHVIIRLATQNDLPELMELDQRVSVEHFGQLVPSYYTEYITPQQYIDHLLKDVENDRDLFNKGINCIDAQRVHVAINENSNKIVGFILYFSKDNIIELNFIAVDKLWRRQGIGTQLLKAAIAEFPDNKVFIAQPLQCNNTACSFYKSLGFINNGPGSAEIMNAFGFSCDKWHFVYELTL